jgi:hypothetical protein
MLVCSFYFACEATGASRARHSLRPLFSEGKTLKQNSREMRGEIADSQLGVIARSESDEAIHRFVRVAAWIASLCSQWRIGCLKIESVAPRPGRPNDGSLHTTKIHGIQLLTFADPNAISTPPGTSGLLAFEFGICK